MRAVVKRKSKYVFYIMTLCHFSLNIQGKMTRELELNKQHFEKYVLRFIGTER
jgi:hypothetical protein